MTTTTLAAPVARIAHLLDLIGDTPDTIAANLRHRGVTGVRGTLLDEHPIIRWLRSLGVRAERLLIDEHELYVWLADGGRAVRIDLPLPLVHWQHRWQCLGQYKDLEGR